MCVLESSVGPSAGWLALENAVSLATCVQTRQSVTVASVCLYPVLSIALDAELFVCCMIGCCAIRYSCATP